MECRGRIGAAPALSRQQIVWKRSTITSNPTTGGRIYQLLAGTWDLFGIHQHLDQPQAGEDIAGGRGLRTQKLELRGNGQRVVLRHDSERQGRNHASRAALREAFRSIFRILVSGVVFSTGGELARKPFTSEAGGLGAGQSL